MKIEVNVTDAPSRMVLSPPFDGDASEIIAEIVRSLYSTRRKINYSCTLTVNGKLFEHICLDEDI